MYSTIKRGAAVLAAAGILATGVYFKGRSDGEAAERKAIVSHLEGIAGRNVASSSIRSLAELRADLLGRSMQVAANTLQGDVRGMDRMLDAGVEKYQDAFTAFARHEEFKRSNPCPEFLVPPSYPESSMGIAIAFGTGRLEMAPHLHSVSMRQVDHGSERILLRKAVSNNTMYVDVLGYVNGNRDGWWLVQGVPIRQRVAVKKALVNEGVMGGALPASIGFQGCKY